MPLGRRHLPLMLTVCLGATLIASAQPGYLAALGPVPLRFLPPVQHAKPAQAATGPGRETDSAKNDPTVFPMPVVLPVEARVEKSAITNEVSVPMTPLRPDDVVSPQMLLRYFNHSTNGPASEIIAPINVIPQRLAEPPSSRATYSN